MQRSLEKQSCRSTSREETTAILRTSKESRRNSSGIFSQGSHRCSSVTKSVICLSSLGQSPETFIGRILFMSMFNDISCDGKDNKEQCLKNADFVKTFAKRFGVNGLSLDQVLRKSGILPKTVRKARWDHVAEDMLLRFAESGHPIFRATTLLSRGKLKSTRKRESVHALQC